MSKAFKYLFLIAFAFFLKENTSFGLSSAKAIEADSLQYIQGDEEFNLIVASYRGDIGVVERLLEKQINPNTTSEDGTTPLMYASQMGYLKICKLLVTNGADVNMHPQNGRSALMAAIKGGHLNVVEFLLHDSANINAVDDFKRTPFLLAAAFGDSAMCQKLFENKADIYARDKSGANAILAAIQNNKPDLAFLLMKFGLDINSVDNDGVSAIMIATGKKDIQLIDLLLQHGASINLVSKRKQSALTIAIEYRDEILIQKLIDRGADVNLRLSLAETPLSVAKYLNCDKFIIDELESKGATLNLIPSFRKFSIGPEISWNFGDFMGGFSLGIKECKFNLDLTGGMLFRPFAIRVLEHNNGNVYSQYWEHRNYTYIAINKNINFSGVNQSIQRGLSLGLREAYTFGSYRGTSMNINSVFLTIPDIGYFQSSKYWQFNVSYLYSNFKTTGLSPHRINISFRIIFGGALEYNPINYQSWE